MTEALEITPGKLTLEDLQAIHAGGVMLTLDPACNAAVDASAAVVQRAARADAPVYGVNTGFGKLATTRISESELDTLQLNLIRSHSVGVGDPLPAPVLRLMLALKAASLARGHSGVRSVVIETLLAAYNKGLLPCVPAQGSVGASGDLAPLAHMTLSLLGEGEMLVDGERVPAAPVLRDAGIEPLALAAKEGLALINGTQTSTALALHALLSFEPVLEAALVIGALTVDAARGSDGPFDPRIHELRGQPGQIDVAKYYRALLAGSQIRRSHLTGDDRVQDPYSLRCQPQVVGACLDQLRHAALVLVRESNAVTDNPLVFIEDDTRAVPELGHPEADRAPLGGSDQRELGGTIAGPALGRPEADRAPLGGSDQRELGGAIAGPALGRPEADRAPTGGSDQRELGGTIAGPALGRPEADRAPTGGSDQRELGGTIAGPALGRPEADRAPSGGSDQRELGGTIVSGGNFHAEPVALAADACAVAIAEVGAIAERRIAMLIDAGVSRLPPFLAADPGLNSGFMIAHVTAASLASENKSLAHPASVDSLPTSANQEDHVSMATFAARRLQPMIRNTAHILGIELLAAAQGIDFLRPLKSSRVLEVVHATLRKQCAASKTDRYLAPDIERATGLVTDGSLARILRTLPALPPLWTPA